MIRSYKNGKWHLLEGKKASKSGQWKILKADDKLFFDGNWYKIGGWPFRENHVIEYNIPSSPQLAGGVGPQFAVFGCERYGVKSEYTLNVFKVDQANKNLTHVQDITFARPSTSYPNLSIYEGILAIAFPHTSDTYNSNTVYIYEWDSSTQKLINTFTIPKASNTYQFGSGVFIYDGQLAVGAWSPGDSYPPGKFFVYERINQSSWQQVFSYNYNSTMGGKIVYAWGNLLLCDNNNNMEQDWDVFHCVNGTWNYVQSINSGVGAGGGYYGLLVVPRRSTENSPIINTIYLWFDFYEWENSQYVLKYSVPMEKARANNAGPYPCMRFGQNNDFVCSCNGYYGYFVKINGRYQLVSETAHTDLGLPNNQNSYDYFPAFYSEPNGQLKILALDVRSYSDVYLAKQHIYF